MVRSHAFSRPTGLKNISRIVRTRHEPVTVTSITTTTNEFDETVEQTTEHTANIWLYRGSSRLSTEVMGDRLVGTLNGIAIEPVDIELDDRLVYNGVEYDVVQSEQHPEDNPQIRIISCEERQ